VGDKGNRRRERNRDENARENLWATKGMGGGTGTGG
jgi:hypothetical protein